MWRLRDSRVRLRLQEEAAPGPDGARAPAGTVDPSEGNANMDATDADPDDADYDAYDDAANAGDDEADNSSEEGAPDWSVSTLPSEAGKGGAQRRRQRAAARASRGLAHKHSQEVPGAHTSFIAGCWRKVI